MYLDAATLAVYIARVTAVAAGVNGGITLSATAKAGTAPVTGATGRSVKVGGAWKGPNGAEIFPFNFVTIGLLNAANALPRVNLKGGTNYAITAGITWATSGTDLIYQGYTTTPGDGGKAIIDGGTSGASYALLTLSSAAQRVQLTDLIFRNNGATGSAAGVSVSASALGNVFRRVVVNGTRGSGFADAGTGSRYEECEAYSCNASNTSNLAGFACSTNAGYLYCISHDHTGSNAHGFVNTSAATTLTVYAHCVADTCGGKGFTVTNINSAALLNCTAYNNTSDGISVTNNSSNSSVQNCLLVSNGGYGVNLAALGQELLVQNCAFYNNTSGQTNTTNIPADRAVGSVTLTGDPFTDAANGDFSLDGTASEGAACRNAGRGAFTQAGY